MSWEVWNNRFWCTTADVSFGPRFKNWEEGIRFAAFLKQDPRSFSAEVLDTKFSEFKVLQQQRAVQQVREVTK